MLWTYIAAVAHAAGAPPFARILQRVRDGAPFDASNARRLRWLGLSLLGLSLNGLAERAIAMAVSVDLPAMTSVRPLSLPVDGSLLFAALLLVALARIFHRGSDLEHEQSLVV